MYSHTLFQFGSPNVATGPLTVTEATAPGAWNYQACLRYLTFYCQSIIELQKKRVALLLKSIYYLSQLSVIESHALFTKRNQRSGLD